MYHNMHSGLWGFSWVGILLIIAIVVVIYLLLRNSQNQSSRPRQSAKTPLEILKERLAKGEISKEEYQDLKKEIED
ncbi:MAG: SHOCT domain-containing protein [Candidatus Marinimicrobia bacterium]|nr:SHOCT domain-containing protein [Candidatus Neomarinimicrobiota bacterium]